MNLPPIPIMPLTIVQLIKTIVSTKNPILPVMMIAGLDWIPLNRRTDGQIEY